MRKDFLLELGCEEIPATMIQDAINEIEKGMNALLSENRLEFDEVLVMATPRRLTVFVKNLDERQPDSTVNVIGPPKDSAFMPDGTPGKAAIGFARAQNVPVEKLSFVKKNEKEFLSAVRVNKGKKATELMPEICQRLFGSMSFPKMMRWGDGKMRFVRPVRNLLVLFGARTMDMELYGVKSSRYSFPHRILKNKKVRIDSPGRYTSELRKNFIIVDHRERKRLIHEMLGRESRKLRCEVVPDGSLEEEVAFMVEFPAVSSGRFAEKFLQLPEEILITTLRHHQKCFSLRQEGRITNGFLAVINSKKEKARIIVGGLERIAEGRLSDAEFYWNEDRKLSMEKRIELLRRIQFHEKLGTYHEKVKRIARLSSSVCSLTGMSDDIQEEAKKAAFLSKADLTTEMVKDFPELQGIMGGIYASFEGMGEDVSKGIYEHYRPMSMEDESPSSKVGAILSVSDKIDTIIGCFGIGLIPSGSKDPFGLRRASQGVLKVCVDRGFSIPLDEMLRKGMECYKESSIKLEEDGLTEKIMSYLKERMKFFFESEGHSYDTVNAVLAAECGDPLDASMRLKALTEIRTLKDFEALAVSHKRIRNIISTQPRGEVSIGLFIEPDEKELYERYCAVTEKVKALKNEKRYLEALQEIASLRNTVDRFFDAVLVMTDEEDLRRNRISLLCSLSDLFMQVADFSEIVVSGQ